MKAAVFHEYGPPDVLKYEDVPDPEPRLGEIRIRVHGATVNRVLDVALRNGTQMHRKAQLPCIPGVDCAGVIDAVGPGVRHLRAGLRVAAAGIMPLEPCSEDAAGYSGPTGMMGIKRPGGFAQMVTVPRSGRSRPAIRRNRVVLPAPLRPSRAVTEPAGKTTVKSSTARNAPKALVRPRVSIIGSCTGSAGRAR